MRTNDVLHPALIDSLAMLPSDKPVALLTRHSTRFVPESGIATYDIPLTPEGIILAEHWGGQINRGISGFYSSPVGRCVETARAMARGAGLIIEPEHSLNLVEPGCYVVNPRQIGPLFFELGPLGFANHHLQQRVEGVLSPQAGAAKVLKHLFESQCVANQLKVHVTHDTILAAFMYHLMGQNSLSEDDWPWMMEGAWLWFDDTHAVNWIWRGQQGSRSLHDYF